VKYILYISILVISAISACKKKPIVAPSVHGIWNAKYSLDTNSSPSLDVIYRLERNGVMYIYNGNDTAKSTEKGVSTGSAFAIENGETTMYIIYNYYGVSNIKYGIEVLVNPSFQTFEGTWSSYANGITTKGNIKATKQN
jgi:hypothetical protein